eukprot:TRINITY_DN17617_c0_g1_i1.p1 TRINITY_DN17617_c0_g1~~TRINITY_DN17617_c0_g1_i1.p1  ORF type:complete len:271 (+),score=81.72 TRINITY_DN17617_c0_g1_i1:51-863(+)
MPRAAPKVGQYTLGETLGKGHNAKVRVGYGDDGEVVAVKLQRKGVAGEDEARNEVRVQAAFRKRCMGDLPESVVELREVMESGKYLYLVMERVHGGDLLSHVLQEPLDEATARWVFREIAVALRALKRHRIAHRDVKPENIFVDMDRRVVKLGDFGLSCLDVDVCDDAVGTPSYAAPELLRDPSYCPHAADCYSLAVSLFSSITALLPARDRMDWHTGAASKLSKPLVDLLRSVLVDNPRARLTVDGILAHPWFHDEHHSSTDDDDCSST